MERKIPKSTMSSIRAKLISAVAMLLVAVTMVVSSTYAWFTLSTAPEVSGITTAIGANGALEIRLNTTSDGNTVATDANDNHTPGNIVDLSAATYGLDKISLLPSQLVTSTTGDKTTVDAQFVQFPTYGANGKPGDLVKNATAGVFNGTNFLDASSATGVRAIGVSSGLTDRQYAYRNAKYAATTASNQATSKVATSLNTNGAVLGNIVIKKSTQDSATYTEAEVAALGAIIDDLQAAITLIETAYEEMIVALAASGQTVGDPAAELPDVVYSTIRSKLEGGTLTLAQIATDDGISITVDDTTTYTVSLTGTTLLAGIEELQTTIANVTDAADALDDLSLNLEDDTETTYEWSEISPILNKLMVVDNTKLNGTSVSGATKEDLANSVMNGGINITLENGAGAYVEIADHCGNYSATVTMTNVEADGMTFTSLTANMATNSTKNPKFLAGALDNVTAAGAPSGNTTEQAAPMTEFYGFIIDLAFKTNAANSNLLLQTEAVDRIYEDNSADAATQGKGSYMTYKATTTELTTEQVKALMSCIRIVFFDTSTLEVIGEAGLDIANATIGADGVTAKMYMYEVTTTTIGEGESAVTTTTKTLIKTQENAVIDALTQNVESKISVLVYLDGTSINNSMVAATDVNSVTGTMNLQFSSSAELKPMEYGDLHTPNKDTTTTTTTTNP